VSERHVLISLGNVGGVHDGLGEFSRQIGQRLAAAAPAWRQQHGVRFHFHLKQPLFGLFGADVGYVAVNRWQQWRAAIPGDWALWHSLHQLNRTRPPATAGARVVTVHDLSYQYGRNVFSTWRHHRRALALMSRTDAVVAISRYTADDVRRYLHWTGPLDVILNGARSFVGAPQQPLPGWPDTPATPDQRTRPFLFHLSRMNPSKNPASLVELARVWPDMHFVLCGPANDHSRQLSASTQLPNVEFHLGISDEQKTWAYAHCAGFLFPSLTEGFGLPPIEAMHFGKPCFLARRTCLPEIGGDAADYFDDFEPARMKQVVQHGLSRMAEPGRADAIRAHASQFNWDRAAAEYLALYARLLKLPTAALTLAR
jgi:glycosyltransferase involved in cell wall biosynthesis